MDDIWKDIVLSGEENSIYNNNNLQPVYEEGHSEEGFNFSCPPPMMIMPSPPSWDQYNISSQPLWVMDEEESNKMLFPTLSDQYFSHYEQGNEFLTG